jgi:predicted transcriptional regulator
VATRKPKTPLPTRQRPKLLQADIGLGPDRVDEMARLLLEGNSETQIAQKLGLTQTKVSYYLINNIYPLWREQAKGRFDKHYATVNLLQAVAWQKFHESQSPVTTEQIKKQLGEAGIGAELTETMLKKVSRTGEACWLTIVQWCLDHTAKLFGYYAAEQIDVHQTGELRVAGRSFAAVDDQMIAELQQRIKERKQFAALQHVESPQ